MSSGLVPEPDAMRRLRLEHEHVSDAHRIAVPLGVAEIHDMLGLCLLGEDLRELAVPGEYFAARAAHLEVNRIELVGAQEARRCRGKRDARPTLPVGVEGHVAGERVNRVGKRAVVRDVGNGICDPERHHYGQRPQDNERGEQPVEDLDQQAERIASGNPTFQGCSPARAQ